MHRKNIKNIFVYVIIFTLVFSFIPFGNFVAKAEETNEVSSSEKKPIEIIEKRTATSKTFDNLDGTYSTEISQQPIHFKDGNGKWEEIDNKLIEKENNKIQNTANDFTVEFEGKVSEDDAALSISDNDIGIEMGLVETNDEDQNKISQKSVNEVTGTVDDNSITYEQVADNVNVVYTVGADRVKEDIIYTEKPENGFPEKFTYQVSLDGLEAQTVGQAIYLVDPETKEKKYLIEAPYMYDSFIPEGYIQNESIPSIPEEAKSYNLNLETRIEDGQLYIDLIPDAAWLNDEKRQYPITIDPTIIRLQGDTQVTQDTTIRSAFPTITGGNDNDLGIGTANDGNIVRSLLRFDLTAIPAATTIISADLNLWFTSTNSALPIDINLQKVTKAWEENEATWNKSKSTSGWAIPGGDYAGTKLSTVSGITSPPSDINNALTNWQVPISVVQGWLTDSSTNHGFLLKSSNESTKIYKKFASSEQEVADKYKPQLVITYKTTARLGIEDYWDYDSRPLTDGTNYVNITTLNNILQYTDLSILGYADFGLDFTRTYNSKDYEKSSFGYGWSFTGDEKIFINTGGDNSKLQYKDADGTIHVFSYDATYGMYYPEEGNFDKLVKKDASTYVLTDPYGYKTTFTVRESTNDTDVQVAYISSQADQNGNVIHYEYSENNRLMAIYTDLGLELGKKLEFDYNNLGLISQAKYNNQLVNYEYTPSGYLEFVKVTKSSTVEEVNQTVTEFKYTSNRISAVIDPVGNKTSFEYADNADLENVTEPLEGDVALPPTIYALDRANSMAIITSPEGEVTRYHVNDNYVIDHAYLPSGEEVDYKLNSDYQISEETRTVDGQVSIVKNTYDSNGNLKETVDAEGNVESYTYTTYQNIETYKDTTGAVSTFKYNDNGNLLESSIPTANGKTLTTSYDYDENGELTSMTTSDGIVESYSTDYSNSTKTTTHTDVFNNKSSTITDLNGNVLKSIDGQSHLTSFEYNLKNELTAVTANDQTTNYSYDNNGNLLKVKNPLGFVTSYTYNGQNQIASETNALNYATTYAYNADGDLSEIKKPDNQIIQFSTKVADNPSTVSVNGIEKFVTRTEGTDTIVEDKTSNKLVRYQYYDNDLLETVKFNDQSTNAIHYTYHGNESVATIGYSNTLIERQIDNAQNMTTLKIGETQVGFGYDDNGLLTNVDYNGVANITKDYEKGKRLSQETFSNNNALWKKFTYGYDANHNITSINGDEVIYTYDALNQLETEVYKNGTSIHYTYDLAGNRKTKTTYKIGSTTYDRYEYNGANQLTKVNGQAYEVDKNGNLIKDDKFRYEWNAFDQLTKVLTIAGDTVVEYQYDDQGRRVLKRINKNGTNVDTYYRYNGTSNQVLFEEDVNGNITKTYTYDDNGYPLTMTYGGKTYYYLTNYRGDVLALVDEAGERVATYTYDAWGNILTQNEDESIASINPYRYAGYRYDEETKLYYLMARYYNSDTGVFLSLDPVRGDITNPITMNGYNYANNNPVMNIDPDGEHPILVLIQTIITPILVWFAKKYGSKILSKAVKPILKKRIQPLINKYLKKYEVKFFEGEVIFKIVKKGKGRLYSFDYGPIDYKKIGKVKSFHYHINYSGVHYVYRWNSAYYKGYDFKYDNNNYKWVWF